MLKVKRVYQDDCTIGILNFYGFRCYTLEPPWLDNKKSVSCIPAGTYKARKHVSPRFGKCIAIDNVVDRSHILIHVGNFVSQTEGCILVGDSIRDINRDSIPDVTSSQKTLDELMALLPDSFNIEIR
jgi:hypothetical protein